MTLATTASSASFTGNGQATVFPLAFPVLDPLHLQVFVTDTTQTPVVVTPLTRVQFTATGIGSAAVTVVCNDPATGQPLAAGKTLTVNRVVPLTQGATFSAQNFNPAAVEQALDYVTMVAQQTAAVLALVPQVPVGSGLNPSSYLPLAQAAQVAAAAASATAAAAATAASGSATAAAGSTAAAANQATAASGSATAAAGSAAAAANQATAASGSATAAAGSAAAAANQATAASGSATAAAGSATAATNQATAAAGSASTATAQATASSGSAAAAAASASAAATSAANLPSGSSAGTNKVPLWTGATWSWTSPGNFSGPGASVVGHLVSFGNATGSVGQDSGVPAATVVTGPGVSIANYVPQWSGNGGTALAGGLRVATTATPNTLVQTNAAGVIDASFLVNSLDVPVRQTVLSGATTNGQASFITTGSGLQPGLLGTAVPLTLAFAAGFGATGAVDYVERITADNTTFFPALPANATSFLSATRVSAGNVTGGSTQAPPQYGTTYNPATQSSLTLNNTSTDDFGNSWNNTSVAFSNTSPAIPGTYAGVFNGTSSKMSSAASTFTSLGQNGWSLRGWFKTNSWTPIQSLISAYNASNYGVAVQSSTAGKLMIFLSSTGGNWDITTSSGLSSAATLAANTWYFIEVTYDAVAGKYFTYINGVADVNLTVASASKICGITGISIGTWPGGTTYWNGYAQGCEFLPYCQHPAGTTYSVPTALPNIATPGYASDWFNTQAMTMNSVSGASAVAGSSPTFTTSNKLYLGELQAGASSISSVVSYALLGQYDSGLFAVSGGNTYSKAHNLGTQLCNLMLTLADDTTGTNERSGFMPFYYTGSSYIGSYPVSIGAPRNYVGISTEANIGYNTSGSAVMTSGYFRFRVKRGF